MHHALFHNKQMYASLSHTYNNLSKIVYQNFLVIDEYDRSLQGHPQDFSIKIVHHTIWSPSLNFTTVMSV